MATSTNFESVDAVLDFAIGEEREAQAFYSDMADKMTKEYMRDIFTDFAAEEKRHEEKLIGVKQGEALAPSAEEVMDLKIADYLVEVQEDAEELSYQQALIIAMKKEKSAFRLYTDLADTAKDDSLKNALRALAQEEAKHKLRLEIEYDEVILTEN